MSQNDLDAASTGSSTRGDFCAPFMRSLPITGIAVSTLGNPFGSETVCASDDIAARLDEIQLDFGEGPCWEALRDRHPVLEPDVQHAEPDAWPTALGAMQRTGLGAVFAFPMHLGTLDIGAVDLYARTPTRLSDEDVSKAVALTETVAWEVLRCALSRAESESVRAGHASGLDSGQYSRREVHQATGMCAAQTGHSVDDALLLLRGHAYATGRSVRDLSADVVARVIDFTDYNDPDS